MTGVEAAEAEYRQTREALHLARQAVEDAARLHQIAVVQLGEAWKAAEQ